MTCIRVPQPIDALPSITMGDDENLQAYFDRYWELYNKIQVNNEEVATRTLKLGLPFDFELRGSLTKQPLEIIHRIIRQIEEYKRLEDDKLQNGGKALVTFNDRRETRMGSYQQRPMRDMEGQNPIP